MAYHQRSARNRNGRGPWSRSAKLTLPHESTAGRSRFPRNWCWRRFRRQRSSSCCWWSNKLADQRLLFASLTSSAFLIYIDPGHLTNRVRTLALAHGSAATIGVCVDFLFGNGYLPAAISMTAAIVVTLALKAVHPPAISTALSFAFRPGDADEWAIFMAALAIIVVLLILQPLSAKLLARVIAKRQTT